MLSSPDRRLAEQQPRLPGLRTILDPVALAAAAGLHGLRVPEGCEPSYVRFKPGTSCLVAYRPRDSHAPALFYASAFTLNSRKIAKALERRVVHSEMGPGRIILGDEAVEVCVFPNDDHLPVLIPLSCLEQRGRILSHLLPAGAGEGTTDLQAIAYKPERRCVMRITTGDGSTVLLKAYARSGFKRAYARATHFCSVSGLQGTQRMLGSDERRRLLALEWLPGRSLADELRRPELAASHVKRAGALLAELHASAPDGLPEWNPSDAVGKLDGIVEVLADFLPEESERAANLVGRVSAALPSEDATHVALHGDFDPRQVIVDRDSVAFVDLDEAVAGPAALDLGNFIAQLHMGGARGEVSGVGADDAAETLLAGYATKHRVPSSRSVRIFTALALLNVAHEPFRRHGPEWPEEISALLDSAERFLGHRRSQGKLETQRKAGIAGAPKDRTKYGRDAAMPWLDAALDPECSQKSLRRTLSSDGLDASTLIVRSARLVRHRPGRRAVIAYGVDASWHGKRQRVGLVAKVRAKGLDRETIRVISSLRDAGFAPDSADGISVPDLAGVVPEWHMWLSLKVEGPHATERLVGADRLRLAARVADAARKIHRSGVRAASPHSMSDEIDVLDAAMQKASGALPHLAPRIEDVSRACRALALGSNPGQTSCIHRDFYGDQIVVAGDRLYILDFDQFCEGDAELDIGNFLAHLTEQAIRLDGDPHSLDDVRRSLCERAVRLGGSRATILVYDLLTLARHIWISTRITERNSATEAILAECESRLAGASLELQT